MLLDSGWAADVETGPNGWISENRLHTKVLKEGAAWDMETLRVGISTPYKFPWLGLCRTIEDSPPKGRGGRARGGIWNHCALGFQHPTKCHNSVCVGTSKIALIKRGPGKHVVGYGITASSDFNSLETPITRFV